MIKRPFANRVAFIAAISLSLFSTSLIPAQAASSVQTFTGSEDDLVQLASPIKSPMILTYKFQGDSVFTIHPVDSSGDEGVYITMQLDPSEGTVYIPTPKKPITNLSVSGTGEWSISVAPLASAPVMSATSGSGTSDAVIKWAKPSAGLKKISFTSDYDGVFIVHALDAKGKQGWPLVMKVEAYKGSVLLPKGTQYLEITTHGAWSYSVK